MAAATASLLNLDEHLLSIPECSTSCAQPPRRAAGGGWLGGQGLLGHSDVGSWAREEMQAQQRTRPLRKCASTPTLHSMSEAAACGEAGDAGMEVYVVLRSFKVRAPRSWVLAGGRRRDGLGWMDTILTRTIGLPHAPLAPTPSIAWTAVIPVAWCAHPCVPPLSPLPACLAACLQEFGGGVFHRLPRRMRAGVRDAGICHYLAVFKQRDGSLVQFDFGPQGGDIHVARGPFAFLSKSADGKMQRMVPGEVRERALAKLPEAHLLVGRTPLSIHDIRAWNALQQQGGLVRGTAALAAGPWCPTALKAVQLTGDGQAGYSAACLFCSACRCWAILSSYN